uniref:ARID domain-containing protein n=1 Tax=Strongyloides papillosus TaxID=174720 RepID=A0A0N5BZQ4_STREA
MSEVSESTIITTSAQGAEEAVVNISKPSPTIQASSISPNQQHSATSTPILNNILSKPSIIETVSTSTFETNSTLATPKSESTMLISKQSMEAQTNNIANKSDLGATIQKGLQEQQNLPQHQWPPKTMPPPQNLPPSTPQNNQWVQQQKFLPGQTMPGTNCYNPNLISQPLVIPNGGVLTPKLPNGVLNISPSGETSKKVLENTPTSSNSQNSPVQQTPPDNQKQNSIDVSTSNGALGLNIDSNHKDATSPTGNSSTVDDNDDSKNSLLHSPSWSNQSASQKTAPPTPSASSTPSIEVVHTPSRGSLSPGEVIHKLATTVYFNEELTADLLNERKSFFERLYKIGEKHKDVITAAPCISKTPVDLFRLWKGVLERGGFDTVTNKKEWKTLCPLSHPSMQESSAAGYQLRRHYTKYVLRLECEDTGKNYEESVENADRLKKKKKVKEPAPTTATPVPTTTTGVGSNIPNGSNSNSQPMTPAPSNHGMPQGASQHPQSSGRPGYGVPGQQSQGYPQPQHHSGEMGPGGYPYHQMPYSQWSQPQPPPGYPYNPNIPQRMPPHPHMRPPNMPMGPEQHMTYDDPNRSGGYYGNTMVPPPQHVGYPGASSTPINHLTVPQQSTPQQQSSAQEAQRKSATPSQVNSRAPSTGPPPDTPDSNSRMSAISEDQSQSSLSSAPIPSHSQTPLQQPIPQQQPPQMPQQQQPSPFYPPPNTGSYINSPKPSNASIGGQGYPPYQSPMWGRMPPQNTGPPVYPQSGVNVPPSTQHQQQQQRRPPTMYPGVPPSPSPQASQNHPNRGKYPPIAQQPIPQQPPMQYPPLVNNNSGVVQRINTSGPMLGSIMPQQQSQQHPGTSGQMVGATSHNLIPGGLSSQQLPCFSAAPPVPIPKVMPPSCVEGIDYNSSKKRKKMFIRDLPVYHPKRFIMALRSGLEAEIIWAINNLEIMMFDPDPNFYLNCETFPDLLNLLVEHLRATLSLLYPEEFKLYSCKKALLVVEEKELLKTEFDDILISRNTSPNSDCSSSSTNNTTSIKTPINSKLVNGHLNKNSKKEDIECEDGVSSNSDSLKVTKVFSKAISKNGFKVKYVDRKIPLDLERQRPVTFDLDKGYYDESLDSEILSEKYYQGYGSGLSSRIGILLKNKLSFDDEIEILKNSKRKCNMECNCIPVKVSKNDNSINIKEEEDGEVVMVTNSENVLNNSSNDNINNGDIVNEIRREKGNGLFNFRNKNKQELATRCLALSNILRGFAFLPRNEKCMARHYGLLHLLGKFLRLRVNEISIVKLKKPKYDEKDLTSRVGTLTTLEDANSDLLLEKDDGDEYLLDNVADLLRQDAFVILSYVAGYLNLMELDSPIAFSIMDGLIFWLTSNASYAKDFVISGEFSTRHFALDVIGKMVIQESNTDLLYSTGSFKRTIEMIKILSEFLMLSEEVPIREYALVILDSLVTIYPEVAYVLANETSAVKYLITFLECINGNLNQITQQQSSGVQMLKENAEVMGTTWNMLRRATNILYNIAKIPSNMHLFTKHRYSILDLSLSTMMDSGISHMLNDILFEVSQYEYKQNPPPKVSHEIIDFDDISVTIDDSEKKDKSPKSSLTTTSVTTTSEKENNGAINDEANNTSKVAS